MSIPSGRKSLRICYVGWADHVHLERWAGYFARTGHDVTVVSFSGKGEYPKGVRQYQIGLGELDFRWKIMKLRYVLWRVRPQLVHAHWAGFGFPVRKAWTGPLAVTAWGSEIYGMHKLSETSQQHVREGLGAADCITCDSADLAARIASLNGVDPEKVHEIQWGVDTEVFNRGRPDNGWAEQLEVAGRPIVLSPRTFKSIYNQDVIVRAFSRVCAAVPGAALLMKNYKGDPIYLEKIIKLTEELGIRHMVRIVDSIPYERMPDLYRMASVIVSIPSTDGTPMSVLEAMACGSIPVVADLPSLREWVQHGWNGYLVDPLDEETLARRITEVLDGTASTEDWRCRNVDIVDERASQKSNMAKMERIYLTLPDRCSPGRA